MKVNLYYFLASEIEKALVFSISLVCVNNKTQTRRLCDHFKIISQLINTV